MVSTEVAERAGTPQRWQNGHLVAGKFRLVRELGRGGMGAVWEAEHLALKAPVAIKLIAPESSESTLGVVRFVREAKAAAALRSPHVVQTLDQGIDGSVPYIVMELLQGETLAARLARQERLDNEATMMVVSHIARALSMAQERGIVHRDLKPANVFVVRDGDEELVKVLDFGVAKDVMTVADDTYETKAGAVIGTPKYMSPEQARGRQVDYRSDLWALAVIAYQCHVGELPFQGVALGELFLQICGEPLPLPSEHGDVSAGFDAWWLRAASREPDQRFQSATEAAAALRQVLSPEPTSAVTALTASLTGDTAATGATWRMSSRTRRLLLATLAIAAAVMLWASQQTTEGLVVNAHWGETAIRASGHMLANTFDKLASQSAGTAVAGTAVAGTAVAGTATVGVMQLPVERREAATAGRSSHAQRVGWTVPPPPAASPSPVAPSPTASANAAGATMKPKFE